VSGGREVIEDGVKGEPEPLAQHPRDPERDRHATEAKLRGVGEADTSDASEVARSELAVSAEGREIEARHGEKRSFDRIELSRLFFIVSNLLVSEDTFETIKGVMARKKRLTDPGIAAFLRDAAMAWQARKAKEGHRLTQKELAARLRISAPYCSQLLSGEGQVKEPSLDTLRGLAEFLGLDLRRYLTAGALTVEERPVYGPRPRGERRQRLDLREVFEVAMSAMRVGQELGQKAAEKVFRREMKKFTRAGRNEAQAERKT